MLEWSHLHFADEFWLHLGVAEDGREEFVEVGKKDVHLVVDSGVQGRQSKTVIAKVAVAQHVDQQRYDHGPQHIVVRVSGIREGVAECGNDNAADTRVTAGEIILHCVSCTCCDY